MNINDQGTFYVEGEYKAGDIILTAGDWELVADVDGYKKYAFGYEPDDFPELVTNGTFDTDISGWTAGGTASLASVGGELEVTASANFGSGNQTFAVTSGKYYRVKWDFYRAAGTGDIELRPVDGSGANYLTFDDRKTTSASPISKDFVLLATDATLRLIAQVNTSGAVGRFDNISVKEVTPKANDTIQLGNGHHKDFRYYPYKLSATDITEMTR